MVTGAGSFAPIRNTAGAGAIDNVALVQPGQASPVAERVFLEQLAGLIPAGCTPIIVTDAGFRAPWLTGFAVEKLFDAWKRWAGIGWEGCATAR